MSKYRSSGNVHLNELDDLPEAALSVGLLETLWCNRGFTVETVSDAQQGSGVTRAEIVTAARRLVGRVGDAAAPDSLLVVHLLGHGAMDSVGGLLLSDAACSEYAPGVYGPLSRFRLGSLKSILQDDVHWRGCNILVVCDFCNSGALVPPDRIQTEASVVQGRSVFARQIMTSALRDALGYVALDGTCTRLTELLQRAFGPATLGVFRDGEESLTAVELRQRLQQLDKEDTFQAFLVGRIWDEWCGTPNEGDVVFFKTGAGLVIV